MKLTKLFIFCISSLLFSIYGNAQDIMVRGKVLDEKGMSVPGASILIQGSKNGTSTGFDGGYAIKAQPNDILVVSFIGYKSKTANINGKFIINFNLAPENTTLNEVVVVGYGTQKRSLVTGAVSSIKAKALTDNPNGAIGQVLQGRISGVSVTQDSGQPGSGSTIRVRGITTFNSSENGNNPLWVVDGVIVDNGGIGYVNQSDIESVEVLKDAATLAIYGARAASGVVLITTKKGSSGKMTVSYNGFTGIFSAAKKLNLLNAIEYATIVNEKSVNDGGGFVFDPLTQLPYLGKGTDWQAQIFNNAVTTNHEISLSGGNEISNFYASVGFQQKEGIVATDVSGYRKLSLRLNSTHKITSHITFGQTLGFSNERTKAIDANNEYGGPLISAINLDPTTSVVITDPNIIKTSPYSDTEIPVGRDANGFPYGVSFNNLVSQEIVNPVALIQTKLGNYSWARNFVGNAFLQITPAKGFVFKTTFGVKLSDFGEQSFTPKIFLNGNNKPDKNKLYNKKSNGYDWTFENTLTYTKQLGNHNYVILLGQGAYENGQVSTVEIEHTGLPVTSYKDASFNFEIPQTSKIGKAYELPSHLTNSLFARFTYNYKEKYLLNGIIRRDGSSKFGSDFKYGYFPSVSAGWVVSKEGFWTENSIFNSLKFRGGYGIVGNDAIKNDGFKALIGGGINYVIGNTGAVGQGYGPTRPPNASLKWESTASADLGMDATLFNDFNLVFNLYEKKTSDILQEFEVPGFLGAQNNPLANVANMQNRGAELELGYRHKFGELNFSMNGNGTYVENKVTFLGNGINFISTEAAKVEGKEVTRTAVGQSYNSFYGLQTAGVFQTQDEINNYKSAKGDIIQPNAKPGDFRWKDNNGDGKIDDKDKAFLGNSLPKLTFGLTLNLDYHGFDFSAMMQGVTGNKIFQNFRRAAGQTNYQSDALGRWTGPGTSNDYPRLTNNDTNGNFGTSDFLLQDGDYLRLKLMTLGYSLPSRAISSIGASKVRVYVTGQNLFTFTKYTGYDPEIGGAVSGVDKGIYPQARGFILGANLQF
jgi:TonB-dependent starch-binding outer membrane protein SusC